MGILDRSSRVQIVQEDFPANPELDHMKRPIKHDVAIVRVGDGVVLGKYRATETVMEFAEKDGSRRLAEVEISGVEAAQRACRANGWVVASVEYPAAEAETQIATKAAGRKRR